MHHAHPLHGAPADDRRQRAVGHSRLREGVLPRRAHRRRDRRHRGFHAAQGVSDDDHAGVPARRAFHDVADADTAFGGSRASKWVVNIAASAPDPDLLATDRAWVRSFWDALQPHASGSGSYVNFIADTGDEERVRASYGAAKYDRLARIKAQYDPDNIIHRNANIKPAVAV